MQIVDIIIIGVAAIALITGAMKGFVRQAGAIAGLLFGIIACRMFGGDVADFFVKHGSENETILRALCYILVFIVVFVCFALIARLTGSLLSAVRLRVFDRIAGAVFRCGLWLLFLSLALNVYLSLCPGDAAIFNVASKPWRSAAVEFAPKILGYLVNP